MFTLFTIIASCDFGFEGDQCEKTAFQPASTLFEIFEDPAVATSSVTLDVTGGIVGYDCGVVSSGKALVFNHKGPRVLRTMDVNTTLVRYGTFSYFAIDIHSSPVIVFCQSATSALAHNNK